MNKLTTATISAITALATVAAPAMARSNYGDHMRLGRAVRSTGIQFKLNPSECWQKSALGWYYAYGNEFVICQENKRSVGVEVQWTEEDLDTLRHEAQHLIQDCMDGSRNGRLGAVYTDPVAVVKNTLSDRNIQGIIKSYSRLDNHGILMELEAFSVGAINDPAEQAKDIQNFCF